MAKSELTKISRIKGRVLLILTLFYSWFLFSDLADAPDLSKADFYDVSGELIYVSSGTGSSSGVIEIKKGEEISTFNRPLHKSDARELRQHYGKQIYALALKESGQTFIGKLRRAQLVHIEIDGKKYKDSEQFLKSRKSNKPRLVMFSNFLLFLIALTLFSILRIVFSKPKKDKNK